MDSLVLLCKIYGKLWNRNKLPVWFLSPIRKIVRDFANWILPKTLKKDIKLCDCDSNNNVIVSLTSFPARINEVWKVVASLKRQSVIPEQIILWLSKDQFCSLDEIPRNLRDMQDDVFSINLVDGDIRSHKKYFYTLQKYPDKTMITCDDDQFYDPDLIKRLLDNSKEHPGCIIANKTLRMKFDSEGNILPYKCWIDRGRASDIDLLQIGVGGVLYPPHCLCEMVLESQLFWNLAPMADDIWLNSMARLKGTQVVQASPIVLTLPIVLDSPTLFAMNMGDNMNDKQIRNIRKFLKENNYHDVYALN